MSLSRRERLILELLQPGPASVGDLVDRSARTVRRGLINVTLAAMEDRGLVVSWTFIASWLHPAHGRMYQATPLGAAAIASEVQP